MTRALHVGTIGALAACVVLLPSCRSENASSGATGSSKPGGTAEAAKQPPVPVAVSAARIGTIASYYTATATIEAEREAQVVARVRGLVESLEVEEGDLVRADQELLIVDNAEYDLRVKQLKAQRQHLEAKYSRLTEISSTLVAQEEVDDALNELERARADQALAELDLSYTTVQAPFAGYIIQRFVDAGDNVAVGAVLFVIADFQPLLAKVHVPAKEFDQTKQSNQMRVGQDVRLVLDSNDSVVEGRIQLISPVIDPSTGTRKVTVEIPGAATSSSGSAVEGTAGVGPGGSDGPGISPGDFAEVQIVTARHEGVTLLPKTCVFTDKGERIVFRAISVSGEQARAERCVVDVGFIDDVHVEITSGIEEGDLVITKGQRSLKHGAALRILEGLPAVESVDEAEQPIQARAAAARSDSL